MGQICSSCADKKGERTKSSAFDAAADSPRSIPVDDSDGQKPRSKTADEYGIMGDGGGGGPSAVSPDRDIDDEGARSLYREQQRRQQKLSDEAELERQRALREEQARLESIVSAAGRDMVAISRAAAVAGAGGGGGVGCYYDPAYAAALARDLHGRNRGSSSSSSTSSLDGKIRHEIERNARGVMGMVPHGAVRGGTEIMELLAKGRWDGVELGRRGGLGGCGGEDPNVFLDDVAETFLTASLPTKEKLFQGVGPIIENLP